MKVYLSMYAIKKTSKKRQTKFFCSYLDTSPLYFVSQKYSINSFFWNYKKIFDRLIITFITLVAIRNNYFFFNASIFFFDFFSSYLHSSKKICWYYLSSSFSHRIKYYYFLKNCLFLVFFEWLFSLKKICFDLIFTGL